MARRKPKPPKEDGLWFAIKKPKPECESEQQAKITRKGIRATFAITQRLRLPRGGHTDVTIKN